MSLIERTRQIVPSAPDVERPAQLLGVGAGYGAVGALALALILIVPSMVAWLADAQSTVGAFDALSFAADGWVLAHRGSLGVPTDGVSVVAPPLLLTAAAVLLARLAATAALASLTDKTKGLWRHVALAFVGGYAATGVLLALVGWIGPARPNPFMVVPGAMVVGAIGMGWALWRDHRGGDKYASELIDAWGRRLPAVLVRALRPALVGAGVQLAIGLLLVLVAIATSWGRVSQIDSELGAGVIGTTVLTLGQLLALPNLAAYGMTWLGGASIHIGSVSLGHAAVTPGILPMVPVLGAVPEAGAGPWWAPFVPVVPVLVGGFIGWYTLRGLTVLASLRSKVQTSACAAALGGLIVLVLAYAGSMGVSGGDLGYVGPSLMAVPLLLVELAVGAVVTATVLHYWRTLR
ncbi:DUF6350 family protein [Luteipulveratus mongoliensis]|uniref:cell division protein PerM n=1 Tax=Luteipulveratus mongoliensis TaxID=571913 RepID=UPI0012ECEBE9|nr:DUF6350 family protein [Luteipulveratus mongoliensis]